MKVRLLAESPLVFEDHNVQGREMYEKSGTTVVHLLLEEGGVLPPVAQPDDVFIYVLAGNGRIRVGDNAFDVEEDTLVKCPIDIPHGAENTGKGVFKLLMVKMPTSTP
jgi:mannose-6-phosphate isomerase-like protein (cupin superfamily)